MVKAVLFDFTQTLADSSDAFRAAEKQAQHRIFEDLALESWDDFLAGYRALRKKCQAAAANFPRCDLWRQVYLHHGRQADEAVLKKWELEYWQAVGDGTALFPEAAAVLAGLSAEYSLGLVTNKQGPGVWDDHVISRFAQLKRLLEAIVVAGDAGVPAKPDPAGFLLCLKRLGAKAGEAVYVGDDYRVDICGARAAGIRPIWIKHRAVSRNWPEVADPAPVIESLDELLDIEGVLQRGHG